MPRRLVDGMLAAVDPADPPWWWLRRAEREALGLGATVERTDEGFVFGPRGGLRVEVTARRDDAPVKLGSAALRLWGGAVDGPGGALLASVARALVARRARGFDPTTVRLDERALDETQASTSARAEPAIVDVPSTCERACAFCHVSAKPFEERVARGDDAQVLAAIERVTEGELLLTGDDALSHPRIEALVGAARRRGLSVSIIGPPRLGRTARLAPGLARAGLSRWQTAIFGADAASHDALAGRVGAFEALEEATAAMRAAGVAVELVTPLVAPLLASLTGLQARARALVGAPSSLLAYAPDSMVGDRFDRLVPGHGALREALAALAPADASFADALPLCVLPAALRPSAERKLGRTDDALTAVWPAASCRGCVERARCPGVPTTVARAVGVEGLVTLRVG